MFWSYSFENNPKWPQRYELMRLESIHPNYFLGINSHVFVCLGLSHIQLCIPMDCSLPGSSVHGGSPGRNIGVNCHAFLQGIFPTQRWRSGIPHCRWTLYHLNHQGSPINSYNLRWNTFLSFICNMWFEIFSLCNLIIILSKRLIFKVV